MIEEYENEQERLFNPCIVYSHDVKSIKIARESVKYSFQAKFNFLGWFLIRKLRKGYLV